MEGQLGEVVEIWHASKQLSLKSTLKTPRYETIKNWQVSKGNSYARKKKKKKSETQKRDKKASEEVVLESPFVCV